MGRRSATTGRETKAHTGLRLGTQGEGASVGREGPQRSQPAPAGLSSRPRTAKGHTPVVPAQAAPRPVQTDTLAFLVPN